MTEPRAKLRAVPPPAGANPVPTEAEVLADMSPMAGLDVTGDRQAVVLGLKLAGRWHRRSASTLARQWGTSSDLVHQVAAEVDRALEAITSQQPARKLVLHQLLLALRECDLIDDIAKRIASRVKVAAEISRVCGLAPKTPLYGPPPAGQPGLGALKSGAGG